MSAKTKLQEALSIAGLWECPKCHGLFENSRHLCYEDTFDALLRRIAVGETDARSSWDVSGILITASHSGYEYTTILNRNVSGARGTGRYAAGISFASITDSLRNAIEVAAKVDADPDIVLDDEKTKQWLSSPEY